MKKQDLSKIISECIDEVLKEYESAPTFDSTTGDLTGTIKISKADAQKAVKIKAAQNAKQSYELYEDEPINVNEMARIANLYKLGPNAESIDDPKLASSPTIQKWLQYIKDNGPASVMDVAANAFDAPKRQQQLNPLVQVLIDKGILEPSGLRSEPKNPTVAQATQKFDSDGEEMYNDDADTRYDDGADEFIGFADKYEKKPWSFRDEEDDIEVTDTFDMDADVPPIPDDLENFDDVIPASERNFDDYVPEEEEEEDPIKERFHSLAGIK